jgi:uncharacterized membrane protein
MGALCSLDAIPLVVYRMLLASLGLAVYFAIFHPTYFRLERSLWVKVILGGLIIGVHWVTFFHAIQSCRRFAHLEYDGYRRIYYSHDRAP